MADIKHLKNAIAKETCEFLTQFLKDSVQKRSAKIDEQCGKSFSIDKCRELEMLLEAFLPKIEEETGKKLFPTYAYARLYQKGEELLCHTDRESCEYSATVTLGFDNAVWPLFVGDQGTVGDLKILGEDEQNYYAKNVDIVRMEIGDAVIYKGCEQPHWRDEFLGEWQTQVFLHYVDQDGPYSEWKYDKRTSLSHHQEVNNTEADEEILYWYIPNAIAGSSCDAMIEKFDTLDLQKAQVGRSHGVVDTEIRDVNKVQIPHYVGIGATLTGMGMNMNNDSWKFKITHSNQSEYLKYGNKGHYKSHVDTELAPSRKETRKITVLAFLNDDFEGGKFYLRNGDTPIYPPQEKGTVLAFPSFIMHGVEPVENGIRRSIVTWLCGPWFK